MNSNVTASGGVAPVNNASSTSTGTVSTNNGFQLNTPSTASSLTVSTMPSAPHTDMSNTQFCNSTSNTSQPAISSPTPDAQLSTPKTFAATNIPEPSAPNTHFIYVTVPSDVQAGPQVSSSRPQSAQVPNASSTHFISGVVPSDVQAGPQVTSSGPQSAQVPNASSTHFILGAVPSDVQAGPQVTSPPMPAPGATSLTLSTDINKEASGSQLTGPPPQQSAKKSEAKKRGRKPTELVIDPNATGAKYVLLRNSTCFLTRAHSKENYLG